MTRTLLVTGLILVALAGAAVFAWLAVDAVWPEAERRYIDEGPDGIAPMDPRLVAVQHAAWCSRWRPWLGLPCNCRVAA